MPSGSLFESTTATTGICNLRASAMAIDSLFVSITNIRSGSAPISLMPPSARSSLSFAGELEQLLLSETVGLALKHLLERLEALDRVRDGAPISQRAAEPAMIDVILRAGLRGIGHSL